MFECIHANVCLHMCVCVCVCVDFHFFSASTLNESELQYSVGGAGIEYPAGGLSTHTHTHTQPFVHTHFINIKTSIRTEAVPASCEALRLETGARADAKGRV